MGKQKQSFFKKSLMDFTAKDLIKFYFLFQFVRGMDLKLGQILSPHADKLIEKMKNNNQKEK